jgi:starch-binding outer membrane protein, SusD/RagB family
MKKRYIILGLAALMAMGPSCKKFLDQQPTSEASDQTTWKSDGDASVSVAACYSLIRSALNAAITHYAYGDLPTDEFSDVVAGDISFRDVLNVNWGIGIPSANTYDPRLKLRLYTNFYTAIAQSNRCLYFIGSMPLSAFTGNDTAAQSARKNHYLGEAYFTRAFNYFYMARVWGDVPLVTTYTADVSTAPQLSRTPQATVLAQAIADLNIAANYLDWKDESSADRVVRADKGAVYALLAHIYAWKGDYDNCNTACDAVINAQSNGSPSYSLADGHNYLSIYQGQSDESIFEIAQNSVSESSIIATNIAGVTLAQPYIQNTTIPEWQLNGATISALYHDASDFRYRQAFTTVSLGAALYAECIKYSTIQNVNSNAAYQVSLNNIIVFRLADIELLKAEALSAKPAPDYAGALTIVNTIRARAGLATSLAGITGPALLDTVTAERGRELFLEGHRFYDLARQARNTGKSKFPNISFQDFQAGKNYWPVDPNLFFIDANLTQTPYWIGKVF